MFRKDISNKNIFVKKFKITGNTAVRNLGRGRYLNTWYKVKDACVV